MRTLYLVAAIYAGLFLSGCSTAANNDAGTDKQTIPPALTKQAAAKFKNPFAVAVYTKKQSLPPSYTVLGKATISKFNRGGIIRQDAYINDAMRSLAASMGGDAVIDLNKDGKTVTGTVIAYQENKTSSV